MELAPPRGTQDLFGERADGVRELYEAAHRLARLYGYRYLETPTFELTELFARTSGDTSDVVAKEMYTFPDKGGRSLTLRPEGTAGAVRAYLQHAQELPNPFRGYYVETFFRYGRPQAGRLREFRQFGIEVIGDPGPGSDVEVIEVGDRFLRGRGLAELTLHLNSIGDEVCRPAYRELLIAYLEPYEAELDEDCRIRLRTNPLRILDCKVDGGKDFVLAAPTIAEHLCEPCAEHFAAVRAGLETAGVAYRLAPHLVRGLDYYTRTAFEFVSEVLSPGQGTVCGGGRYDGLVEVVGGRAAPAIGFGLGLDRVLLAMEAEGTAPGGPFGPTCFVVTIGAEQRDAGARLLAMLHEAGVSASRSFAERPLRAQLKMADQSAAAAVALLGEHERVAGTVTLRRLSDGVQQTVGLDQAIDRLRGLDEWPQDT